MPSYFRISRNIELSLLYYLETNLATDWSGTTLCKTFKQVFTKNVSLPIVCVRLSDTASVRLEIGSNTLLNSHLLIIDIFARSDGQRLDMADYIKDKIKDGWVHYDHSHPSGSNTTLTRVANGRDMVIDYVVDSKIDFGLDNVDEKDQFRHTISVRVRPATL